MPVYITVACVSASPIPAAWPKSQPQTLQGLDPAMSLDSLLSIITGNIIGQVFNTTLTDMHFGIINHTYYALNYYTYTMSQHYGQVLRVVS